MPDDGLDFRRITPAETLYVGASSGEIADARTPDAIVLRGGHHIGPVAPFLEVFARTAPDRIEPLTIDLLRGHGLSPADVRWTVGIGNLKAFRRTGDQGDKAIARLARISDHAAHPLETTAPNFLPGKCFLSAQCVTSNPMPPHSGRTPFDWLISIANTAKAGLFMTFPFGIVKDFRAEVYDKNDDILRYAMLEMYVNGGNKKSRQEAKDDTIRIRRFPNAGMALGSYIKVPTIDGWIKERGGIGTHVNWVHTKFMLVDPLGDTPVVVTGSANRSLSSINANDENLVVIKGTKRAADIYFGEFMRIFAHYRFREASRFFRNGTARSTTGHRRICSTSLANGCPALQEGKRVRTPTSLFRRRVTQHINVSRNDVQVIASLRSYRSRPTTCLSAYVLQGTPVVRATLQLVG